MTKQTTEQTLTELLQRLSEARTLTDVNIAAGTAGNQLAGASETR